MAISIKATTPYMLRNDGALLECGEVHPYIKLYYEDTYDDALTSVKAEDLEWFYKNTLNNELKDLIILYREKPNVKDLERIGDLTNQEFCRVRTSNYKYRYGGNNGEIYFRISSVGFNWFDLIWSTVATYRNFITNVSIMKDYATFGEQFVYYKINGHETKHMPTNEFLTLSGSPIIE